MYLKPFLDKWESPNLLGAEPMAIFFEIIENFKIGMPVNSEKHLIKVILIPDVLSLYKRV